MNTRTCGPFSLVFTLILATSSCTIIRYVDNNDDPKPGELPVKVIDMLVLADMDRSSANLNTTYEGILEGVGAALGKTNVEIRKAAVAPLYRRSADVVPLIFGQHDPAADFADASEALAFYALDNGGMYLTDVADGDGENLATLGITLAERAIYHPITADPDSVPYFLEPADGFLIVTLSASPRKCGHDERECQINGLTPATYFSQRDEDGASWIAFPEDASLSHERIFHAVVATEEGVGYEDFYKTCSGYANFPLAKLDVMQPSDKSYFRPFVEGLKRSGSPARFIDLCEAMSSRSLAAFAGLAAEIRKTL
jgi:hypothetical protein